MTVNRQAPGPRGHFLFGSALDFRRDPLSYVVKSREQFGDVVRYRIGSLSVYQITHPDGVEQVLQTHHKKFRKGHFHHKFKLLADWSRGASNDVRISGNLIWLEAANL